MNTYVNMYTYCYMLYSREVWWVARKFGEFGESSTIRQSFKLVVTINKPFG